MVLMGKMEAVNAIAFFHPVVQRATFN